MKNTASSSIKVRNAADSDIDELSELLNEIIDIGGTTAFQQALSLDEFKNYFLDADECLACFVAQAEHSMLCGVQSLRTKSGLATGWVDIATFARVSPRIPGTGRALLEMSKNYLSENGFTHINATIRADNVQGLGYYTKMGFEEYAVDKDVPLADGTPVDRISKVYSLS